MIRTHTVRIYPNKETETTLFRYLNVSRYIYNQCLEQRIKAWKRRKESVSQFDQQLLLTQWRDRREFIRLLPVHIGRDTIRRLDRAFKAFWRRLKSGEKSGFPKFKGRNRWNSFEVLEPGHYVKGDRIRVPGIREPIRCRGLREFEGKTKGLRILRRAGKWYAQLVVDDGKEAPPKRPIKKAVGLDVGLKYFAVNSNGEITDNPRFYRRLERKLGKAHRVLSRRKKGSNRRRVAVNRIQKVYARITNCRSNFTHHLSKYYAEKYDLIGVEDLNIKGMVQGHFGKSILDAAWTQFIWQLSYKAEACGSRLVKINPRGTSLLCSACGRTVPKDLSVRVHKCPCGYEAGRDHNAAKNILARALLAVGEEVTDVETSGYAVAEASSSN